MPQLSRRHLVVALSFALGTAHASAQHEHADDRHKEGHAEKLDRVVVTASPLRSTEEAIAQPAEVLSGAMLDRARAATLGETISGLPGVQASHFGAAVSRPIIRGLDGARVGVLQSGLATLDASALSQDHAAAIEPFLADQIEVLKGPATLLFGTGAIGGIVNVVDGRIPEAPIETLGGRAETRYDSATRGFTHLARVDGGGDRLAWHVDGLYRDLEDYETPHGRQQNSFNRGKSGAFGSSWITDVGFVGASIARYENRYGNPGEPGDAEHDEPGVTIDMNQDRYELRGGLTAPAEAIDALRVSVAHTDYEHTEFEGDEIGTRFLRDGSEGRLELSHTELGGWLGAIGLQASDTRFEAIGEEAFVPRTNTRSLGLFLVEQRSFGPLQFEVGGRVDRVRTDPIDGASRSFRPHSLSASGLWQFDAAWRLSLNLDHAERAPAEEELFANGPHAATASFEIGNPDLRREQANQAELGLHFHGERLHAKLSAYRNRFEDFIYLVDTGGHVEDDHHGDELPVRQWTQADARFRGFEAEAEWRLADNDYGRFDLRAFADSVRATLADGGNLPRIAPARLGLTLDWQRDAWRASLSSIGYKRQNDVAENETPTAGYALVNAHVAYHVDGRHNAWEVFFDAKNLTDRSARVHTSFLKDSVALPGRNFALGLRLFF